MSSLRTNLRTNKPKLAVWKFSSCDGCQLSLLDCEDQLLQVVEYIEIAYFLEATRLQISGPYDISLVEGSVTTPDDKERILKIREQSKILVTIGACATAGGIQALKNYADYNEFLSVVYAHPTYIKTLEKSFPISDYVKVDFELRGCPINKMQLLEVIASYLSNKKPNVSADSVCLECKQAGHVCVMVAKKEPCLGPMTHAGCTALCPEFNRACYSCYGPKENANPEFLMKWLEQEQSRKKDEILRLLRSFNIVHPQLEKVSRNYE